MFTPSRTEARQFFFETWERFCRGEPLTAMQTRIAQIIAAHPEYQPMLEQPARYGERDYPPEFGETNPFLHLSMHLALAEQIGIDQPPGIRAEFERIRQRQHTEHEALHAMMDCLAEMIWQAQRAGAAPDPQAYMECLRRR